MNDPTSLGAGTESAREMGEPSRAASRVEPLKVALQNRWTEGFAKTEGPKILGIPQLQPKVIRAISRPHSKLDPFKYYSCEKMRKTYELFLRIDLTL